MEETEKGIRMMEAGAKDTESLAENYTSVIGP